MKKVTKLIAATTTALALTLGEAVAANAAQTFSG